MNLPSQFSLEDKVALITGASRGIGAAIAHAYAAAGARVMLCSRKASDVEAVAAAIRGEGGLAQGQAAHTGDPAAIEELVANTIARWGGIDILVNNAATSPHFGPLLSATEQLWHKTLDINVVGYWRMIQACVPTMRARNGGKIINIASIAGKQAQPNIGVYSVSKAAVLMLTEAMALELAPDNIQVNAIAPGYVKTRFSQAFWDDPTRRTDLLQEIPQQRLALPEEITGLALYLAAPASSFTTGATMLVDGGQYVGSPASSNSSDSSDPSDSI